MLVALAIAVQLTDAQMSWWKEVDASGWVYASNTTDGTEVVFWQMPPGKQSSGKIKVWMRNEFRDPRDPGYLSERTLAVFDCDAAAATAVSNEIFRKHNLTDSIGHAESLSTPLQIPPSSAISFVFKAVCQK